MRWQIGWQGLTFAVMIFIGGLFLGSRLHMSEPVHSTAAERLQPAATAPAARSPGATVYVPVYSSVHNGLSTRQQTIQLSATLSVRNVSTDHPIVLEWVRYHDSTGKLVRNYLDTPSALPPLSSVEFVIQRADTAGGPGASFLVHWKGPPDVDAPIFEAVMLGQNGGSFTSQGRTLTSRAGAQ